MEAEVSLKSVVLFIAFGTLVSIIVFIFAKRQITRFALKSNRAPHVTIGADAPKELRKEIERRLKRIADIRYEPQLLSQATEQSIENTFNGETCHFLYRMKAVDAISLIDTELKKCSGVSVRKPGTSLRSFLLELRKTGPLRGIKLDLIQRFADCYEYARHDPQEFRHEEYQEYMDLLNHVIDHIATFRKDDSHFDCIQVASPSSSNMVRSLDTTIPPQDTTRDAVEVELNYRPEVPDGYPKEGHIRFIQRSSVSSLTSDGFSACLSQDV